MEEFLRGTVTIWVQQWGYLAVFLGIMFENAGIPLPGETIIVVASVFAGKGLLDVKYVFLATIVGAIIGPNFGYYAGRRGGRPILVRMSKLLRMSDSDLLKAEAMFRRRSDMAIFGGRFIAFLRIFAGPIAGVMHMPFHRFFVFNALGAVVWATVVVGLAYILGEHVAVLLRNAGLTMLSLVIIAAAYGGYKLNRSRKAEEAAALISPQENP